GSQKPTSWHSVTARCRPCHSICATVASSAVCSQPTRRTPRWPLTCSWKTSPVRPRQSWRCARCWRRSSSTPTPFPMSSIVAKKSRGPLQHDQPVLEAVLAAVAIGVGPDDGRSPRLRLDALGRHTVAAGSSQKAIFEHLVSAPLARLGLRFTEVDKYATELHNPEVTEPAGSGNVPQLNYRVIAGLAALRKEITPAQVTTFVTNLGMPGFAPTLGLIASI